jgi:hypothetical protein
MNMRIIKFSITLFGAFLLSSQAHALALNDAGVVGTIEAGTQASDPTNETDWANYLLSLGANTAVTADGNNPLDGATENYQTSATDYNGILGLGVQGQSCDASSTCNTLAGYDYILAKYDGQNAGYVLFNVADWGSSTFPMNSFSIGSWLNNAGNGYQLSHLTGFNVDAPTTLMIMSIGLLGVGFTTWKKKYQA